MSRVLSSAVALLILAGCAAQPPSRVAEDGASDNTPLAVRIANLEQSAQRLRQQYEAMDQSLQWVEGEIKGLKAQQHAGKIGDISSTAPTPPAAAETRPTPLTPSAPAAKPEPEPLVAPLSSEDLEIQRPTPDKSAETQVPAPPVAGQQIYLVHLSSYRSAGQIVPGWHELSAKHASALTGLSPFTTAFEDSRGQSWLRLSAGPFTSPSQAGAACNSLKSAGAWCEVLTVSADFAKPVALP